MKLPDFSNLTKKYKNLSSNLNLNEKLSKISNVIEEKCTEVSDSIDLDEKISKVSDVLGLDTKLISLSNTLDGFGKKYTDVSGTSKPEERRSEAFGILNASSPNSHIEPTTPDIDLAFSNTLNHHNDKCTIASQTHRPPKKTEASPNIPSSSGSSSSHKSVIPDINLTFPSTLPSCKEISDSAHKDPRVLVYYMSCYSTESSFSVKDFSECFIEDAGNAKQILEILKSKNWIQEKDPVSVLMTLYTVNELKTFLQVQGLKVSGKKEELVKRLLEKVPFENFKHKYKHTLYSLTELGEKYSRAKRIDYDRAVMISTGAIKNLNFLDAVKIYNSYDNRWGFLHASDKPHTIFAGYEIPSKCFDYISAYPMLELQNSNGLKNDLRAFLLTALMRGKKDGIELQKEFMLINQESVHCPSIIKMYRENRNDNIDAEDLERIIDAMQRRIKNDPDCVLGYYISKVLYNSRHI